jgi:hypothetical protein
MPINTRQSNGNAMKRTFLFISLFQVAGLCFSAEVKCPLELEKTEQKLPTPLAGWEARQTHAKYMLGGVMVSYGDPDLSQGTPADEYKTFKTKSNEEVGVSIWHLKEIYHPYFSCYYEATDVTLIRSVEGLSTCELRSTRKLPNGRSGYTEARCY